MRDLVTPAPGRAPVRAATLAALARYAGALHGQATLITGAGSGIGRAIAVAFATAGADVALIGRREASLRETAELVRAEGGRSPVFAADVTDAAALEAAVARATAELGAPEIAVAAAGLNAWATVDVLEPAALAAALATNVAGVAHLARAVLPGMRARRSGKLIVVASDNGRRPEAGGGAYVASKFGALGFALSIAQELYADGVSVHVIEPGCVDTPWYPPGEAAPRARMLAPEDVALGALFLATLPGHIVLEELLLVPRDLLVEPWA